MGVLFGVDIGGTNIKTALISEQGEMLDKRSFDTHPEHGFAGFGDRLKSTLEESLNAVNLQMSDVHGVGVGVPGFLDIDNGVIIEAVNLGWKNVPLVPSLQAKLGVPIAMENDANVAALGEAWRGAGRDAKSVLLATVGTGVGGGIVIDGRLYRGVSGMAGEIGHIVVNRDGIQCNCGLHGCLETEASATAIIRAAKEAQADGRLPADADVSGAEGVFDLAEAGNTVAEQIVKDAAHWLGYGLSMCAITLNPDAIVIGGGVSKAKEMLLNPVREAFLKYSLPLVSGSANLQLAALGNDAGVMGAARLIGQKVGL